MCRILMVAGSEKETGYLERMAQKYTKLQAKVLGDYGQAKKELASGKYALCIVCLQAGTRAGQELIEYTADKLNCGIIVAVSDKLDKELIQYAKRHGAMVVKIPTSEGHFHQVVCDAYTSRQKIARILEENRKLAQELKDIRLVSRAKCLLIQEQRMSEEDAHHYIERQAMDQRIPKREVATKILHYYLNGKTGIV